MNAPLSQLSGLVLAIGCALGAWVVAGLVCRCARRLGLVDLPNERSLHANPTPRGGGLGIVVAVAVAVAIGWFAGWIDHTGAPQVLAWALGSMPLAAVCLWDDRRPLSPRLRLVVQIGTAALTLALLAGPLRAALAGLLPAAAAAVPGLWTAAAFVILLLWIVGLTNVYNFLDGIDGIAGLQAAVAAAALASAALSVPVVLVPALALAGASLGFLLWNWSPARIFMGDVGSAFLGFTFAVLPLMAATAPAGGGQPGLAGWLGLAVAALWPFLFDGIFTFVRRIRRGEKLLQSHRSHLYQRLVMAGASHAAVTLLYGSYALAGAVVGRVAWQRDQLTVWLMAAGVIAFLAVRLVLRVHAAEKRAAARSQ